MGLGVGFPFVLPYALVALPLLRSLILRHETWCVTVVSSPWICSSTLVGLMILTSYSEAWVAIILELEPAHLGQDGAY